MPTGSGVMIKLSGKEAQHYLKHELKDMKAKAYEDARVIDQYSLTNNNCTTKIIEGAKAGGAEEDFQVITGVTKTDQFVEGDAVSPAEIEEYLNSRVNQDESNVKILLTKEKKI